MRPIDRINYLNIGLMIGSCVAAYLFPFELFLFSYAVLGPLHYLTEISWLHERNYFTESEKAGGRAHGYQWDSSSSPAKDRGWRASLASLLNRHLKQSEKVRAKTKAKQVNRPNRAWLILVIITMGVLLLSFVAAEILRTPINPKWEITLFYLVLIGALLITEMRNKTTRVVVFVLALASLALFSDSRYYIILAFFFVTIIHVLVFTGAFILQGALKSRSSSGILSLAVFVLCALIFFVYVPEPPGHAVGEYVRNSYRSFNALNAELIKLLNLGTGSSITEIYESKVGLMIMRLIAFAYTYHYLNWFSKTTIIKWHEVPKSHIAVITIAWLASLGLYAYNYDTGMAALYFLSILHVMLEFPLNHRTFAGIGRELYAIAK